MCYNIIYRKMQETSSIPSCVWRICYCSIIDTVLAHVVVVMLASAVDVPSFGRIGSSTLLAINIKVDGLCNGNLM